MEEHHKAYYRAEQGGRLPMWTVYGTATREYPGKFVARLWHSLPSPEPTEYVLLHAELDGLRGMIPLTCTRLARQPDDAPEIIEVWL